MSNTTYDDLVGLADAELDQLDGSIGSNVGNVLDQARINADDTVFLEKNSDCSWEWIALATIESILAHHSDKAVQEWFTGHGVQF